MQEIIYICTAPAFSATADASAFSGDPEDSGSKLTVESSPTISSYDQFMANWQASPEFKKVDDKFSNLIPLLEKQGTTLDTEWCLKYAHTGSFLVLQNLMN